MVGANNLNQEDDTLRLNRMVTERERLKNSIISSYKSYRDGKISRDTFIALRSETDELITELEAKMDCLSNQIQQSVQAEVPDLDWGTILEQALSGYNGELFARVIDKVYIYEDKSLEIVYKGNICNRS